MCLFIKRLTQIRLVIRLHGFNAGYKQILYVYHPTICAKIQDKMHIRVHIHGRAHAHTHFFLLPLPALTDRKS